VDGVADEAADDDDDSDDSDDDDDDEGLAFVGGTEAIDGSLLQEVP